MTALLTQRRRRKSERGYSLLEVLIVLTIIALVAALVGPRLMAQLDRSKVTATRVQLRALASAIETMRIDIGRYPTGDEGLALLVQPPRGGRIGARWQGPYLEGELPLDPWGGVYIYAPPASEGGSPRLVSYGADGEEGGSGLAADIVYGDAQ
jgi:general secretion pathway protein G